MIKVNNRKKNKLKRKIKELEINHPQRYFIMEKQTISDNIFNQHITTLQSAIDIAFKYYTKHSNIKNYQGLANILNGFKNLLDNSSQILFIDAKTESSHMQFYTTSMNLTEYTIEQERIYQTQLLMTA